tara:strand:- start:37743 stop:38135 length:393 start_codon:yes stop_codon:yes gene_type:complete
MHRITILIVFILSFNTFISYNVYSNEKITNKEIVSIFKRSMMHWNINYDNLEKNKSGAACIPWNTIDKKFIDKGIFIALGFGFNLYDLNIAKKASLEGCERMRAANKIKKSCKCEMILYNDEILINSKNE